MKKNLLFFLLCIFLISSCKKKTAESEYSKIQHQLKSGWGTFNSHNAMSFVYMPDGLEISYGISYQGKNFNGFLNRAQVLDETPKKPMIKPIEYSIDRSYNRYNLTWDKYNITIEYATEGNDIVVLFQSDSMPKNPTTIVVQIGMLWNKPGRVISSNEILIAELNTKAINVYACTPTEKNVNTPSTNPYFALSFKNEMAISTGKVRSIEEIKSIIKDKKNQYNQKANNYGKLSETYKAIMTSLAWNTIYDAKNDRIVSTVARSWNVERGGYSFFGWDNFFLSYLAAIDNKEMAYSIVIEHLKDVTDEGFIPNCSQGNGRKTFDRSQPPVGSMMVYEIYKKYPEKWFLDSVFDKLLTWNRWWMKKRYYKGMLCWGSHISKNPFNDNRYHDLKAAMLETGIDDSPMYEGVAFNADSNVMELHDVGLNSMYVADCEALKEIASVLGKKEIESELANRAIYFRNALQKLWDSTDAFYYNYKTDENKFYKRLSPTLFYPLLAKAPTTEQAKIMIEKHFYNSTEFWGTWILPSISRNDSTFHNQKYWKGSVWAPLNFLVYMSLRNYDLPQARKDLAEKSLSLFMNEWKRKSYVCENYSSETGKGDDLKLKSHHFYTWGALLGAISFMEEGYMDKKLRGYIKYSLLN